MNFDPLCGSSDLLILTGGFYIRAVRGAYCLLLQRKSIFMCGGTLRSGACMFH